MKDHVTWIVDAITGVNYTLKYIKIENSYLKILKMPHVILLFLIKYMSKNMRGETHLLQTFRL